jgi:1-phosphofructokinase family hexose kinase
MILAVCLSPAFQRTLVLNSFSTGRVNRVASVALDAGGKGINAARVAVQLGEKVLCLTCLGGSTGRQTAFMLRDQGVRSAVVPTQSATRTCTTILSPDSETELVEESASILPEEVKAVSNVFFERISQSRFVIFSGTAAPGFPDSIYREMGETSASRGVPFLIDTVSPFLDESLKARPDVVKLNLKELESWSGMALDSSTAIEKALGKIVSAGAKSALVTGWPGEAWALADDRLLCLRFPELKAVNTIGSGDAASAGIAVGFIRGMNVQEAFRYGIACACANVLTPTAGSVNVEDVERILPDVVIDAG